VFVVFVDLAVEGERPGEEVDPAYQIGQHSLRFQHDADLSFNTIVLTPTNQENPLLKYVACATTYKKK
jgi:hypothetical protein